MTFVAGASASINKTIDEIERILQGRKLSQGGVLRQQLRDALEEALVKSSKSWYKKGFNRGHKESYLAYKETETVPSVLKIHVQREFIPKSKSKVVLKSTLPKSFMKIVGKNEP